MQQLHNLNLKPRVIKLFCPDNQLTLNLLYKLQQVI